jgi:hypothetical protein
MGHRSTSTLAHHITRTLSPSLTRLNNSRMTSTSSTPLVSRSSSSSSLFPPSSLKLAPKVTRKGSETPPISASRRSSLERKVEEAKRVIREAIDVYGCVQKGMGEGKRAQADPLFGFVLVDRIDNIAISFNGGKDCELALLLLILRLGSRGCQRHKQQLPYPTHHLVLASGSPACFVPSFAGTLLLHLLHSLITPPSSSLSSSSTPPLRIKALYITAPNPFQEVEDFVDQAVHDYNLDLVRLGGGMKSALGLYLDDSYEAGAAEGTDEEGKGKGKGKGVKGMLVGTRRNDPHGGMSAPFYCRSTEIR